VCFVEIVHILVIVNSADIILSFMFICSVLCMYHGLIIRPVVIGCFRG